MRCCAGSELRKGGSWRSRATSIYETLVPGAVAVRVRGQRFKYKMRPESSHGRGCISNDNLTSIMVLVLVHGNIGPVARAIFFKVMFRVRY